MNVIRTFSFMFMNKTTWEERNDCFRKQNIRKFNRGNLHGWHPVTRVYINWISTDQPLLTIHSSAKETLKTIAQRSYEARERPKVL
jgi:hypothetical protein